MLRFLSLAALLLAVPASGFGHGAATRTRMSPRAAVVRMSSAEAYGASHTSFYTSEEKKDKYDTLDEVLATSMADVKLRALVKEQMEACVKITMALRNNLVTVEGTANSFGDVQLTVDVIADELMWEACKNSELVKEASSEEEPVVKAIKSTGEYIVCWDPLDGSSIVDNNWAVGTMIGIWHERTGFIGATGRDQVTSIIALYGPRTTVLIALDNGVSEFTLAEGNKWICSRSNIKIAPDAKIFAPANLRSSQDLEGYQKLVDHWMSERYTLRYSGGLVPDVYQQFTKRQGVFSNPTSKNAPAKLRLAFEAAPFGLLVEKAGGKTSDGVTGGSILDVKITAVDQRTALCIGSANEVDRFNKMVLGK
jgi:sedoheptulose-bisphosphatase